MRKHQSMFDTNGPVFENICGSYERNKAGFQAKKNLTR
jgi:hypothetical protein